MTSNPSMNTVGAGSGFDTSVHIGAKPDTRHRQRYHRTLQHYITNNNASSTPSVNVTTSNPRIYIYREGWHYIPYSDLRCAMTQAEIDAVMFQAKRYRVVNIGYVVKSFQPIQTQVSTGTGTTSITSNYVTAPKAMLFRDTENEMFELTFVELTGTLAFNSPIMIAGASCNRDPAGTTPFSKTYAGFTAQANSSSGTLPTVQFQLQINDTTGQAQGVVDNFGLENGGDIELISANREWSYKWENPVAYWATPFRTDTNPTNVPALWNPLTVPIQQNAATQVAQNVWHQPQLHLIRVPPLANELGGVTINIELIVEYFVEIEWEEGKYLFSRVSSNLSSAIGVVFSTSTNTRFMPYPVSRREITEAVEPGFPNIEQTTSSAEKPERERKRTRLDLPREGTSKETPA